jgi:phosphopantothenoylcysteine decarboxylase/phosphopantothenate--cysteine ligase
LFQKKILLGVSGGIAAYKAAELCRQLKKAGAEVRVVMTDGAQAFVAPLTFQALSGRPVHTELLDPTAEAGMGHIELARWPDLIVIAPASANLIARFGHGFADELLTTVLLASASPIALVPAMNQAMWRNPLTQRNLEQLRQALPSLQVWGPDDGEQACGDVGPGRMLEPLDLLQRCERFFAPAPVSLKGCRVVITAGPTREAIDPVRYISNHSSGKMGFALAAACHEAGARVTLVAGPVALPTPHGVRRIDVVSAAQMYQTGHDCVTEGCDIFIAAAAVADYRPDAPKQQKLKKQHDGAGMQLTLTENPDIVASIAARADRPMVIGFAAETQNVLEYARDKRKRKKLDMIIANDVSKPGQGFDSSENEVWVLSDAGEKHLARSTKTDLATQIVASIVAYRSHP